MVLHLQAKRAGKGHFGSRSVFLDQANLQRILEEAQEDEDKLKALETLGDELRNFLGNKRNGPLPKVWETFLKGTEWFKDLFDSAVVVEEGQKDHEHAEEEREEEVDANED